MLKKSIGTLLVFFTFIFLSSSIAYSNTVQCELKSGTTCDNPNQLVFWTSDSLSSHVRTNANPDNGLYNNVLCCNSPYGDLNFTTKSVSESCSIAEEELLFFTSSTNSRVAVELNESHHNSKLCVGIPSEFSTMDLLVSDSDNFERAGYSCMFRANNVVNGLISSCDSTFNGGERYNFTAWVRLFENLDSLKCNSDCTSKLDNRVYSACSQKISVCRDVPVTCDGSILGSWVEDPLNPNKELKCSPPWNIERSKVFTNEDILIDSDDSVCSNVITKKYSVILDNEPVVMKIIICGD